MLKTDNTKKKENIGVVDETGKLTSRYRALFLVILIAITGLFIMVLMTFSHIDDVDRKYETLFREYVSADNSKNESLVPSYNYNSEITMPHQSRIYDLLMNIDGLTDETKEQISEAWSNKVNNLQLIVSSLFDEGSIMTVILKLDDMTYIKAQIQWHSNECGWELTRWERCTMN